MVTMDLSSLNPNQRLAVSTAHGPMAINAGPGTGKTKTLISKISFMADQGFDPASILAITFTRKAAAEIQERLGDLGKAGITVSTFHGLAHSLIGDEIHARLAGPADQTAALEELTTSKSLGSIPRGDALRVISLSKNGIPDLPDEAVELTLRYNEILVRNGLIDYDDLLITLRHRITSDAGFRESLKRRYRFILVDEFQDTNRFQYELVKSMLNEDRNICVIGDPLQSIYAFRGADASIFDAFHHDFPDAVAVTLDTNYRSSREVIEVSHRLFPESVLLKAAVQESGLVQLVTTVHEYSEADWIIKTIGQKIGGIDLNSATGANQEKARFSEFAVIFRTHHAARALEAKFNESGIPYQKIGDESPYRQPAPEAVIRCLTYLHAPDDDALLALLESPIIGVKAAVRQIVADHKELGIPLRDAVSAAVGGSFAAALNRILTFTAIDPAQNVSQTVERIIDHFGIEDAIKQKPDALRNLNQLRSTIVRFNGYDDGLSRCVEYFAYLREHDFYDAESDKVTLLTIHAAKGLEFPYVFISGFHDGIIPLTGRGDSDIDEEKRLLYVAMTRAKRALFIVYAKERERKPAPMSRFQELIQGTSLDQIDDEAIAKIEKKRKMDAVKKSQMSLF